MQPPSSASLAKGSREASDMSEYIDKVPALRLSRIRDDLSSRREPPPERLE